jgi:CheY-like chemotaxis protein
MSIGARISSPECDYSPSQRRVRSKKAKAMNMLAPGSFSQDPDTLDMMTDARQGAVAVVSDDPATIASLAPVCEFLQLRMEIVSAGTDLSQVLREHRPMAVISSVDGLDQDGFHAMKIIAGHNRELPIMLLTDGDPMLMGAADAVQDLWGLTSVTSTSGFPVAGQLMAFLFDAGRRAGCLRLVPI